MAGLLEGKLQTACGQPVGKCSSGWRAEGEHWPAFWTGGCGSVGLRRVFTMTVWQMHPMLFYCKKRLVTLILLCVYALTSCFRRFTSSRRGDIWSWCLSMKHTNCSLFKKVHLSLSCFWQRTGAQKINTCLRGVWRQCHWLSCVWKNSNAF